jgi:hypothetical protein
MKDRAVNQEETELTIANPDSVEKSTKERLNAFKFVKGRYLRVTFKEEQDQILVVTVTVRKKPFGGPHENRIQ